MSFTITITIAPSQGLGRGSISGQEIHNIRAVFFGPQCRSKVFGAASPAEEMFMAKAGKAAAEQPPKQTAASAPQWSFFENPNTLQGQGAARASIQKILFFSVGYRKPRRQQADDGLHSGRG